MSRRTDPYIIPNEAAAAYEGSNPYTAGEAEVVVRKVIILRGMWQDSDDPPDGKQRQ